MGNYGIKVSKPGFDVLTTNDVNLSLKSDFTLLKVAFSGTIDPSGETWVSITHNLGYKPQFLVYLEDSLDRVTLCSGFYTGGLARVDNTYLYISGAQKSSPIARYYIFYEQI